jgi:hypothetical protein
LTPQAEADRLARQAREAAALRENLRRRKDQVRGRAAATRPPETPTTLNSGEIEVGSV